jgi:response regulator RpfG family c-di-GMP phosphodiesterase
MPSPSLLKARFVCEALAREGVLRPEQVEGLVAQTKLSGERVEELLLGTGLLTEQELLRHLSATYKVNFISSEKLARADVSRALVNMIPERFAEKLAVCPVLFDAKTHTLTVVTADPDDEDSIKEVLLASGSREVKPVLARPAAVRAAITKAYRGDIHAFDMLDLSAQVQFRSMRGVLDRAAMPEDQSPRRTLSAPPLPLPKASAPPPMLQVPPPPRKPTPGPMPAARVPTRPPPPPLPKRGIPSVPPTSTSVSSVLSKDSSVVPQAPVPGLRAVGPAAGPSFLELLNVLVSLLENDRADLRGHSSQVARLARRLAEKLGLEPAAVSAIVCASYVHDLGKMGRFHLTALNCAEYDGHKVAAQKVCDVPPRLLEPVRMPPEATQAVAHMYERYDGKGFPDGQAGKDIPLGARIVAICDTYADLTQNPRNPYRQTLSPTDACAALSKHKGTIFDPNLVDLFHHTVLGEDLRARLLANRSQALLVDTDPEETTVLELRMIEQGFVVKTARTADQALRVLAEGETDLVISELDLGQGDGLTLLAQARKAPWGKELPWVVYTRRQERTVAQKALEMGVLDFVNKPANADVLVAKLKAMLDQRANARTSRGVSGSLREMGLPDMVQVLFHGRKTGNLRIRSESEGSGEIHFLDGNVVDAAWGGLGGADAFYAMLKLEDGEFALDPAFKPKTRVIHESSEALLLEGMRRMDEGIGP